MTYTKRKLMNPFNIQDECFIPTTYNSVTTFKNALTYLG